jgi:hypothetical protein
VKNLVDRNVTRIRVLFFLFWFAANLTGKFEYGPDFYYVSNGGLELTSNGRYAHGWPHTWLLREQDYSRSLTLSVPSRFCFWQGRCRIIYETLLINLLLAGFVAFYVGWYCRHFRAFGD